MPRFAKFCWFVLIWTILVILWGAYVRASGSGAGCGNHWPTCNGEIIPQPEQMETAIEFTHRLLSGIALVLIFTLVIWGWKISQNKDPIRKGLVASAIFIISESLLGASLVLFGLVETNQSTARAVMMALHLVNTFLLLATITLTAWWAGGSPDITTKQKGHIPLLLGIGLVGVMLIGMSGAITALGDTLFPADSLGHGIAQELDPNAHFLIRLRIYHPALAILIGAYVLLMIKYLSSKDSSEKSRKAGLTLGALIVTQWAAGLINVLLLAPIPMQIIHLLLADLVWISLVLFSAIMLSIGQIPNNKSLQEAM